MSRKHFKRFFSWQYEKYCILLIFFDISIGYDAAAVDDILDIDIDKYFMNKNGM